MTTAKTTAPPYTVGQRVWVYGYNIKTPRPATVAKVGRKLVTVAGEFGWEETYRIDTGRINDNSGHQWVKTEDQRARDDRRDVLTAELRDAGLEVRRQSQLGLEALEAVAAALRASSEVTP